MPKTSTERARHALSGATMGTRWSAVFFGHTARDLGAVQSALQRAVDEVDQQMSTWRDDSDLMRLNRAPVGEPVEVPAHLAQVLALALDVGRASGGAFDIGMGDAVRAWGFGPQAADLEGVREAMGRQRRPAHVVLELEGRLVAKRAPIVLDLNGIAKGYGVDRLAQTLAASGIGEALVGIDGEMRATGLRPDGQPWTVAIEAPELGRRAAHSILSLHDAAVATSGDYRHRVTVQGRDLAHTMDPRRGAPLLSSPASVSVVARSCAEADAWATALMVAGPDAGAALARRQGLSALFLMRDADVGIRALGCGSLFAG
jgi:thiamine biosynthesis lipoprotein